MATVDDRVVAMAFENSQFEARASRTLGTLRKLRDSLRFDGAGRGLDDVSAKASRFSLAGIGTAVDSIRGKFSALSIVGVAALATLASKAVTTGLSFARSFTIRPITDGLQEYETNLNSVQTILANTQASGARLEDVNRALLELNHYSDRTIYNFSEMAKNIGTFTAAGVDLRTATSSIKGIANLAALSGSNSAQASTAMYQLSQAISAGRVSLEDWNSVVNAGMGGTVFQRALAQTAVQMGTLEKSSLRLVGPMRNVQIAGDSFRNSITARPGERSWLTSEVLTRTLTQFTGDMTAAELAAEGFSRAQIRSILATARTAQKAATEVKTLRGVLDTAREAAGSGWAQTWQLIFGDFGEAKTLFTGLSNSINGFISSSANARNSVLRDWKALGGRTALIEGIRNVFAGLRSIITPIKDAFRDIFPPTTGKQLYDLTVRFREFTRTLRIGPETAENLRRTFAGFFAILSIGKQVVTGIFGVIGDLIGAATGGSGGFLRFTGSIGDWLVSLDKAIKSGRGLSTFFEGLGQVLSVPIRLFVAIREAVLGLFDGFDESDARGIRNSLDEIGASFNPLRPLIDGASAAWDGFLNAIGRVREFLAPAIEKISELFSNLGDTFANGLSNTDWGSVFAVIQTGLLGGIFLLIRRFFQGGFLDFGQELLGNVSDSLGALTGTLQAMQTNIKADTLMKISIAIGLLTASVVALSLIDGERLKSSMTALAVGFGQLLGAMAILTNISSAAAFVRTPIIAASLIALAIAIDLLVLAVLGLSRLSWDELARGLAGVAGLLAGISAAAVPLSRNSAGMTTAGVGILAIAVAMNVLALAVKQFGNMQWEAIAKGLAAVTASLVAIGGAAKLFPVGMPAIGLGLIAVGAGLVVVSKAVSQFADMSWGQLARGIASVAASLLVIAGAMTLMPPTMMAQAAGLVLVALALQGITHAVKSMGGMSMERIGKGLLVLGGALAILAIGLNYMTGALPGAGALFVAAAALSVLVPALKILGNMSWSEIITGFVALGGAMLVLGGAGLLLTPVAPALLALGVAILAIGGGLALAGVGISAIAAGIAALAVSGPAGIKLLVTALTEFAQAIPTFIASFVTGMVTVLAKIAEKAPEFVEALGKILANMARAVVIAAPQIAKAMTALIQSALTVIRNNGPQIVDTGLFILVSLLRGIRNNISQVVSAVGDIIVNFINALAQRLPRIINAGLNLLVRFISGIARGVNRVITASGQVVAAFITGVSNRFSNVLRAGVNMLARFITGIGNAATRLVTAGANAVIRFITGVGNKAGDVVKAATTTAGKFITAVAEASVRLIDTGTRAVILFIRGVAQSIQANSGDLRSAGADLAFAIADGFSFGLASKARSMADSVGDAIGGAIGKGKSLLGINSPSKVFAEIGSFTMQGMALGISRDRTVVAAISSMSQGIISSVRSTFQINSPSKVMESLGKYIGEGFAKGLRGSERDVSNAYKELNRKLLDAQADAVVKANKSLLNRIKSANKVLIKGLADDRRRLEGLAKTYDGLTVRLKEAKDRLRDLKAEQDSAFRAIFDSFNRLPEIGRQIDIPDLPDYSTFTQEIADIPDFTYDTFTALADYTRNLADQAAAIEAYRVQLDQLRSMGLSDTIYQMLLRRGVSGAEFAKQLLEGGQAAIDNINNLANNFVNASQRLDDASRSLSRAPDQVGAYARSLQEQAAAMRQYKATLDQLRALGLNDTVYKNLLDQGVSGQEFADQLLAGGTAAVGNINNLANEFTGASQALTDASTALSTTPDLLGAYQTDLANNAAATERYKQTLDALRRLGLDDTTYQMLLDRGVSGQEFASQLLAGGKPAVDSINALNARMARAARSLATDASRNLYDAGVQTAEGLVRGLRSRQSRIRRQMERIARMMIRALKRELRIRSPSREFERLGTFSTMGLVEGLESSTRSVAEASANVGNAALDAMRESMDHISDVLPQNMSEDPVITPVLDLTQVEKDAQRLSDITNVTPISAASSFNSAAAINAVRAAAQQTAAQNESSNPATLNYTQNNYSPESLSSAEIYRQTRNQLSQAKSLLELVS